MCNTLLTNQHISRKEYTVTLDKNNEKLYTEKESDTYIYDETWKDKLTSYNGKTISYDASGNPTGYLGHSLSWTMGRQLASYDNISYTYDENGMRASKTVNGKTTKYYYDGTRLIKQIINGEQMTFLYDRNEELVGFFYCNQVFLYVKNLQGDITGIISDEGFLAARYVYDDWGNCISVESGYAPNDIANLNPFRYCGYYYDNDTGLYYLQSRYYDPEIGRFINCDDINYISTSNSVVSYNPFAYCENDPVNFVDSLGCKKSLNSTAITVCIIMFLMVVDAYKSAFKITSDFNKKGTISIDLTAKYSGESFSNIIFNFYELIGNKVFDVMAAYATTVFYEQYHIKHNQKHSSDKTA